MSFDPGFESMAAAGIPATRAPYMGSGAEQIRMSLETMAQKMREGRLDASVRGWALDCLRRAGLDGRDNRTTPARQAAALLDEVRSVTVYVSDPYGAELVPGASATLCLRPGLCLQGDDCDGLTVAYGSACMSIGLPVQIVKQSYGGSAQEHVLCVVHDGSEWRYADPSTNMPFGSAINAANEIWIDPMGAVGPLPEVQPEIVTFGRPAGMGRPAHPSPAPHWLGLGDPQSTGVVLPGDVLAYRNVWNDFVVKTAQALAACAAAWTAAANGTAPTTPPNTAQFAAPPDKTTLTLWATSQQQFSNDLIASWNAHANSTDAEVVILAEAILQDFQSVVKRCGEFYQPQVQRDCPSLALPKPPSIELQKQVIGQIEGLGILARGLLQIFEIGADGAFKTYASIANTVTNPTTFQIGGVGALVGVVGTLTALYALNAYVLPIFRKR